MAGTGDFINYIMSCLICKRKFPNKRSLRQHENSREHRTNILHKLVSDCLTVPDPTLLKQSIYSFTCPSCLLTFNSRSDFQEHAKTEEHRKLARRTESAEQDNAMQPLKNEKHHKVAHALERKKLYKIKQSIESQEQDKITLHSESEDRYKDKARSGSTEVRAVKYYKAPVTLFHYCKLCGIFCSDLIYWKKHVKKMAHKRLELLLNKIRTVNSDGNCLDEGARSQCDSLTQQFYCNLCFVQCDGKTFDQHLKSKNHKKMEIFMEKVYSRKQNNGTCTDVESSRESPHFCELCNTPCDNSKTFNQHVNGAAHEKREFFLSKMSKAERLNATDLNFNWNAIGFCHRY